MAVFLEHRVDQLKKLVAKLDQDMDAMAGDLVKTGVKGHNDAYNLAVLVDDLISRVQRLEESLEFQARRVDDLEDK